MSGVSRNCRARTSNSVGKGGNQLPGLHLPQLGFPLGRGIAGKTEPEYSAHHTPGRRAVVVDESIKISSPFQPMPQRYRVLCVRGSLHLKELSPFQLHVPSNSKKRVITSLAVTSH
jgi:hypothetical protein